MNLPENKDPSPVPAFMREFAMFFQQQEREAEEALRQNYALHEAHLAYREHALAHIQADQPAEAEAALRCFSTEEAQRLNEQARLLAILGRQERSPHAERQEVLVRQLIAALPSPEQPDGEVRL
jgi:uncharacterized protein Smg (DUF494 family)